MTSIEGIVRRIVREEVRAALEQWDPPAQPVEPPQDVLSLAEAAEYLDVAEATLRDWRVDRKGPRAIKYGRLVKYRVSDLQAWLADHDEEASVARRRPRDLLGIREAADLLGVATQTLSNWRSQRKGPPAVKVGRLVKYRREDLDEWVDSRPTS